MHEFKQEKPADFAHAYKKSENKDINNVVIDTLHTSLADFIAGKEKKYFDTIISINPEFWESLHNEIERDYSKIFKGRLEKMSIWSDKYFISSDIDTCTLFYPFSGPDFLHANFLYPHADEYILLALEKVGKIPDWKDIGVNASQNYLENTNEFLRDIYLRSYFITKHMRKDIEEESKGSGVLSSLYWFLSRTDHHIVKVERVTLDSEGMIISIDKQSNLDGVRFYFVKKGGNHVKKLTYFSCDISNRGFREKNPELLIFLNNMKECNTFIKSASYLMHYRSFTDIRNIILSKSLTIFQDDTGIPFKNINNDTWTLECFGNYIKPVADFEKSMDIIYQKDLEEFYKNNKKQKLPFSLGYHWKSPLHQNQMLISRIK